MESFVQYNKIKKERKRKREKKERKKERKEKEKERKSFHLREEGHICQTPQYRCLTVHHSILYILCPACVLIILSSRQFLKKFISHFNKFQSWKPVKRQGWKKHNSFFKLSLIYQLFSETYSNI
jgi:hypothetical protein